MFLKLYVFMERIEASKLIIKAKEKKLNFQKIFKISFS